jgi:hypothetical protein
VIVGSVTSVIVSGRLAEDPLPHDGRLVKCLLFRDYAATTKPPSLAFRHGGIQTGLIVLSAVRRIGPRSLNPNGLRLSRCLLSFSMLFRPNVGDTFNGP